MATHKIKLKNAPGKAVILDDRSYKAVSTDKYLTSIGFIEGLRAHSSGYPIFQWCVTLKKKKYVIKTIYLHRWLAEKFMKQPKSKKKLFLRFKNGNIQDCRLENLEWATMADLRRQNAGTKGRSGYRGVTKQNNGYRAALYHDGKTYVLGVYKTAAEAAKAYNKKSEEMFGKTNSLNVIKKKR